MSDMDTAARVRGKWRHAVAISNVDTEPLLEYEQPLPIHERDGGLSCQRNADRNVADVAARVRRVAATRRRKVKRGYGAAIGIRTTATNPRT